MMYQHNQFSYEIDNEWLDEAGAAEFVARREFYRANTERKDVFLVPIASVKPFTEEARSRGIFCDDLGSGLSARERVVRILRWLVADEEMEPVAVVPLQGDEYEYKLVAGCHRFHCANALGFKKVPAIIGFDINDSFA